MDWAELRQQIVVYFNLEELQTLCMDIGVDYDSLGGDGKEAKVRELIGWCRRHGRVPELMSALTNQRPNVAWQDIEAGIDVDDMGQSAQAGSETEREVSQTTADSYDVQIGNIGPNTQIAIGHDITQSQSAPSSNFANLFHGLRNAIESETVGKQRNAVLERYAELKAEIESPEPDLGNLQESKDFFVKLGGQTATRVEELFRSEPMQATLKRAAEIAIQSNINRLTNSS